MAEESNGFANEAGGENAGPSLHVLGQYLKDLSFENPKAPASLEGPGENPNLQIDINVGVKKLKDDVYESAIEFKGTATNDEGDIYVLEAVYAGAFEIKNIPEASLEPLLLINCPAILYPFLRRMIADVTREGGFPPLLLDPIDFAGLYKQRREAKAAPANA